jgi:drug/metabolite transporter (DMT)-like permease
LFVALAGLAGLVWGVADFSGGKAAQRADALAVVWLSKLVSLPLLVGCVALTGTRLEPAAVGWGVLAGVCGTVGTALFYRALSAGSMTTVAPVTSVTSAAIPVLVGLGGGERPSSVALGGISCALVAVALVGLVAPAPTAGAASTEPRRRLVGMAAGAGLGFALFMVCLARAGAATGAEDGLWPVLASHGTGLVLGGALLIAGGTGVRRPDRPTRRWPAGRALAWACAAGLLDTSGSATFLVATRHGDLSLVAPLAALYPVSTVLLALLVDKERPRPPQVVGLLLAVAALQLVARPTT